MSATLNNICQVKFTKLSRQPPVGFNPYSEKAVTVSIPTEIYVKLHVNSLARQG